MSAAENDGDFLQRLGTDAAKWAAEFVSRYPSVPEDEAIGWFANAIENSTDVLRSRLIHDDEAWEGFKGEIDGLRAFLAELRP